MSRTAASSSHFLGIRLEADQKTYAPGDTVIGCVYRKAHAVSVRASVTISVHGRSYCEIEVRESQNQQHHTRTYHRELGFFDMTRNAQRLFEGPLHIAPDSEGQVWPFAVTIPPFIDNRGIARDLPSCESYLPIDHEDIATQPLPPTFWSGSDGYYTSKSFIEYYLQADLRLARDGSADVQTSTLPLHIPGFSPEPPITDFNIRRQIFFRSVTSQRLIPGMENAELSFAQKTQKLFRTSKVPHFYFELEVEIPTVIQLENPNAIPFRVRVKPAWDQTSEIIRNLPQKVKLTSLVLELKSDTEVTCGGRFGKEHASNTHETDLQVPKALQALGRDVFIPCTAEWPAIDIGELINFRVRSQGRIGQRLTNIYLIYPCFTTYNIKHSHRLKWKLRVTIAGEEVKVDGQAKVIVLPPSDTNPAWTAPPLETQETESWIHPPADDEAPPSFAETQKEGRASSQEGGSSY
ncbi:hypothetical protein QBC33DRAFT_210219 [Phialemonium atrogriseum]|uniref:Arrestin-like N-terminal domain-containing protein n=1 Tax=Phialemonium atrogriseum TaxID=1093897 RepID=A0AAJ0BXM5_9PEZI|nr:uncharacterized protein QBC33DRAFT_210219 [Phialemonium atrogriseum]KAK1763926.1 hypothetical protein QBC33DRAFT_210219 [Phialemonium atrogriseum]